MVGIKLLLVNYAPDVLIAELNKKGYNITTFCTLDGNRLLSSSALGDFDLVYFAKFTPPMCDDIDLVLKRNETPVIYAFHAPMVIFSPFRAQNHLWNFTSLAKTFYMKVNRSVAAIHALNTTEAKLANYFGFKSYFVPLGIDTSLLKSRKRDGRFTVVFVNARFQKGVDMLPKIVALILKRAPDIKFALMGTGFLDHYFAMLKAAFSDNVDVYGFLSQDDFVKTLGASNVFLFPSRYESYGLAPLEALSCGVPVVCFDINGVPRDVVLSQKAGTVVDKFDINKIANAVLDYYELWKNNRSEYDRLSAHCRDVALGYDWCNVATLFDNMFKDVVNRS